MIAKYNFKLFFKIIFGKYDIIKSIAKKKIYVNVVLGLNNMFFYIPIEILFVLGHYFICIAGQIVFTILTKIYGFQNIFCQTPCNVVI